MLFYEKIRMQKLEEFKQRKALLGNSYIKSSKKAPRIQFTRNKLASGVNAPLNRFRKLTLIIIQLNQAVSSIKKKSALADTKVDHKVSNSDGIVFDLSHYKRQKGVILNY